MRNLRLPGALIGLGFLGVLAWTIAYLSAVLPAPDTASVLVYWLTTTAGYGLAGFACWRWIVGNWNAKESRSAFGVHQGGWLPPRSLRLPEWLL